MDGKNSRVRNISDLPALEVVRKKRPRRLDLGQRRLSKMVPYCAVCTAKAKALTLVEQISMEHTTDMGTWCPEKTVYFTARCHGCSDHVEVPYLVVTNPEIDIKPVWAFVEQAIGETKAIAFKAGVIPDLRRELGIDD